MDELLTNQAPLGARVFDYVDAQGIPHALLVAKGSWDLLSGKQRTSADGVDALAAVHGGPVFRTARDMGLHAAQLTVLGERAEQQITVSDHDQTPPKPRFDVIVEGNAHAPHGKAQMQFDVGLAVGGVATSVRAVAPRYWKKGVVGLHASQPVAPVSSVPLSYAFTASDCSIRLSDEALAQYFQGQTDSQWQEYATTVPPWIESPGQSTTSPNETSARQCLNFWPEYAPNRLKYVGTYDECWRRERAPRLPIDFDHRFYNVSDSQLQLDNVPQAGTPMHLINVSRRGTDHAVFPAASVSVMAHYSTGVSRQQPFTLRADTLVFEPDLNRFSVTWRALIPLRSYSLNRLVLNFRESAR